MTTTTTIMMTWSLVLTLFCCLFWTRSQRALRLRAQTPPPHARVHSLLPDRDSEWIHEIPWDIEKIRLLVEILTPDQLSDLEDTKVRRAKEEAKANPIYAARLHAYIVAERLALKNMV
ncbi:hypothetical protein BCR34DRAFT_602936 [Clohesyomyces aquaticus]|uniref:Uncharacterized protein n=1 Tax=Clohesyomyces aquaticus TaxID=1231657 RepID=A0A1Y1ZGF2_9PLEO|nr:hypothetical protein BCR34DRAFT_602936 [Clohesyomyces aquaticus]